MFLRELTSLGADSGAKIIEVILVSVHGKCRISELALTHAGNVNGLVLIIVTAFINLLCHVISQI